MAYVGCIAGAILIEDYRQALLEAGFAHVEVIDSGRRPERLRQGREPGGLLLPRDGPALAGRWRSIVVLRHAEAADAPELHAAAGRPAPPLRRERLCRQREGLCGQSPPDGQGFNKARGERKA